MLCLLTCLPSCPCTCCLDCLQLFNTGNPLLRAAMFVLDRAASFFLPSWLYTAHARNVP